MSKSIDQLREQTASELDAIDMDIAAKCVRAGEDEYLPSIIRTMQSLDCMRYEIGDAARVKLAELADALNIQM